MKSNEEKRPILKTNHEDKIQVKQQSRGNKMANWKNVVDTMLKSGKMVLYTNLLSNKCWGY